MKITIITITKEKQNGTSSKSKSKTGQQNIQKNSNARQINKRNERITTRGTQPKPRLKIMNNKEIENFLKGLNNGIK